VTLTDTVDRYALGTSIELLEDPTGALTIAEVTAPPFAPRFEPSTS
jgi:hypothetical protein